MRSETRRGMRLHESGAVSVLIGSEEFSNNETPGLGVRLSDF